MNQEYIEFVLPQLVKWQGDGKQCALLTLTHVDGSSPYPVGSQMLVRADSKSFGMITGGCIEAALVDEALSALSTKQSHSQRYGKESPYMDIQLPCGSGLDIYFDVSPNPTTCREIVKARQQRRPSELVIDSSPPYVRSYLPKQRIAVIGQGSIYTAFVPLAHAADFELIEIKAEDSSVEFDMWTAAVCLFHDHDKEIGFLTQACASDTFYIGALGSHRAHQQRCQALSENGVNEASLRRIHSPAGLDIGSQTPHEIALSILAEIITANSAGTKSTQN